MGGCGPYFHPPPVLGPTDSPQTYIVITFCAFPYHRPGQALEREGIILHHADVMKTKDVVRFFQLLNCTQRCAYLILVVHVTKSGTVVCYQLHRWLPFLGLGVSSVLDANEAESQHLVCWHGKVEKVLFLDFVRTVVFPYIGW